MKTRTAWVSTWVVNVWPERGAPQTVRNGIAISGGVPRTSSDSRPRRMPRSEPRTIRPSVRTVAACRFIWSVLRAGGPALRRPATGARRDAHRPRARAERRASAVGSLRTFESRIRLRVNRAHEHDVVLVAPHLLIAVSNEIDARLRVGALRRADQAADTASPGLLQHRLHEQVG